MTGRMTGKILSHTGAYSLGTIAQSLLGFLLVPLYTRSFTVEEFGVFATVVSVRMVLSVLSKLGLENGFFIAYFETSDPERRDRVFLASLGLTLVAALAAAFLVILPARPLARWLLGDDSFAPLLLPVGFYLVVDNLFRMVLQDLRARERAGEYAVFMTFRLGLGLAGIVGAVALGGGLAGLLWGEVAGMSLVAAIAVLRVAALHRRLLARIQGRCLDAAAARRLLSLCLPLVPASLASWVLTASDRVMLTTLSSPGATALYDLAARTGAITTILFLSPFALAWGTLCFAVAKEEDAARLYRSLFTHVMLATTALAGAVALFAKELVLLLGTPEYRSAAAMVPLVSATYVVYAANVYWTFAPSVRGRTMQFMTINAAGALLNIALNLLLIPRGHAWGALAATLATNLAMSAGMYRCAQGHWAVDYEWGKLLRLAAIVAAAAFAAHGLVSADAPVLAQCGVKAAILLVALGILPVSGFFDEGERKRLYEILSAPFRGPADPPARAL